MKIWKAIPLGAALALATLAAAQTPAPRSDDQQTTFGRQQRRERMRDRGGYGGQQRHDGVRTGDWLRRYARMSPEEQNKALAADPQFRQLPPDHQQRLRHRLQEFNDLRPERKQQILDRMAVFENLPQEQKDKFRQYAEKFRQMPPERRHRMRSALRHLREVSPEGRERTLSSARFTQQFSAQEIEILRGMAAFQPPSFHDDAHDQQQQSPQNETPREP